MKKEKIKEAHNWPPLGQPSKEKEPWVCGWCGYTAESFEKGTVLEDWWRCINCRGC